MVLGGGNMFIWLIYTRCSMFYLSLPGKFPGKFGYGMYLAL